MELYHQAKREPPQHLLTLIHLTEVSGETLDNKVARLHEDLTTNHPAVVIDRTHAKSLMPSIACDGSGRYPKELHPVTDFICTHYIRAELNDGSRVYFSRSLDEHAIRTFPGLAQQL